MSDSNPRHGQLQPAASTSQSIGSADTATATESISGDLESTETQYQEPCPLWKIHACEASIMASFLTLLPFLIYAAWETVRLLCTHTIVFGWSWIATFVLSFIVTRLHEGTATFFLSRLRENGLFVEEACDIPIPPPSLSMSKPKVAVVSTIDSSVTNAPNDGQSRSPRRIASPAMYTSTHSNPEMLVMRATINGSAGAAASSRKYNNGGDDHQAPFLNNGNYLDDLQPEVSPSDGTTNFLKYNLDLTPSDNE